MHDSGTETGPLGTGAGQRMNSFELNKILGAVLGTCLVLVAVHIAAGAIFTPGKPAKPGYVIAVKEEPAAGSAKKEPEKPLPVMLASANVKRGQATTKLCQACHSLDKGGPNRVGPNLWGVVGRPRASHPGYDYSAAMKAKGGNWTYDELYKFLAGPQRYIPGTKMTFAGVSNDTQRADLIAYLRTLSDNPLPLPTVAQAKPPAAPAPAPNQPPPAAQGTTPNQPAPAPKAAPSQAPPPSNK